MLTFSRRVTIEWQHCDPAGIVFYPRYFAMFDTSTTMLFEHVLGMTKYQLLKKYDFLGYPMVETRSRFMLPTRFGDEVEIKTTLIEVKHSSFTVEHQILKAGQLAVEGALPFHIDRHRESFLDDCFRGFDGFDAGVSVAAIDGN